MNHSTRTWKHSEGDERGQVIFFEALALPVADRESFVVGRCGEDHLLLGEVRDLLRDHASASGFLDTCAAVSPELAEEFMRARPEAKGDRIGRYKLLEQIGEGGFGTVWVAAQERPIRRQVALKIIKLGMDTKEVVGRFEQERQALAMMEHPNIAKALDAGATQLGRPYFVMELVRGVKITTYCDEAQLSTEERLKLFIAVCAAVHHAHQKGIIHRDLKPSNVLVTLHDGVPVPKVIDFGIAKATQQQKLTDATIYTRFEQMIGTPLYMAPEQAELSGLDVDTRSDIYSLGVLLYELLTGRTPFDAESLMRAGVDEMRRVIREQEPQKPSTRLSSMAAEPRALVARDRNAQSAHLISRIRGDLDWVVMRALEKDRARRYESAAALAQDIQRHLGSEPVQARPPSATYQFSRFVRRNRGAFTASAAVALSLVAGAGVGIWQGIRAREGEHRANAALADLRATAPAFVEQARNLAQLERFDEAIEKLEYAIKLRPDVAAYLRAKADLLESQFHFAEAARAYRACLALEPSDQRALAHAELCEKLAAESDTQGEVSKHSLSKLFQVMSKEARPAAEMLRVGKLLGEQRELLLTHWRQRLKMLPLPPEYPIEKALTLGPTGRLQLNLSRSFVADLAPLAGVPLGSLVLSGCTAVKDLTPLRGMPLEELYLGAIPLGSDIVPACGARDLAPLRGLPLKVLNLHDSLVSDIAPLRGMPLKILDLTGALITDLAPLSGMALVDLSVRETQVSDLTPLRGMPLQELDCFGIPAKNFSPLAGAPLKLLRLNGSAVGDLSFLQGMPLKELSLHHCPSARGFRVLQDLKQLEILQLPEGFRTLPPDEVAAIEQLRNHPKLRQISAAMGFGVYSATTQKDVFWAEQDRERTTFDLLLQLAGGERWRVSKAQHTWTLKLEHLPLSDLTPLKGLPISTLMISGTAVTDLRPLEGMPLRTLYAAKAPLTSLEGLRGLPLTKLFLDNCPPGLDLSPLRDVPTLTSLLLPPEPKNLELLRDHPGLKHLSHRLNREEQRAAQTAAEFWSGIMPVTAESLAREGKFADAERLLLQKVERSDGRADWLSLGAVVLAQGEPAYQELCRTVFEREPKLNPDTALKICVLGPRSGISAERLAMLTETVKSRTSEAQTWRPFLIGLHEYRAGNTANAVEILQQIRAQNIPALQASTTAVLAMARHAQGQADAATEDLGKAREAITSVWPAGSEGHWHDWLIAHLLLNEAEQLMTKRSADAHPAGE